MFVRLREGGVSPADRLGVLEHADGCPRCHQLLARALAAENSATLPDTKRDRRVVLPQPGERIAHYTIKDAVGRGGMGVVLRAHDTKLGRDIALKLIASMRDKEAERRLVREAQAMAQLSHPNVVAVHDVDRYAGGVYFAMELVEGATMRQWQDERRPHWRRLVLAWVGAGEGLAAAHAAGIVHRDFKPANVLIGPDGRARVTDFGLAGVMEAAAITSDSGGELATSLTRTGAIMGTPRYMSPEQMAGDAVDHRADQFSFGVSLYHSLYGGFPFEGRSLPELRDDIVRGQPRVPRGHDRPGALWPVVRRTLSLRPDERYAAMDELLGELRRICEAPRRRRLAAGVGLIGVVGLAGGLALGTQASPDPCEGVDERVSDVWGPAQADAVRSRMDASALPYAADVFARTNDGLERYMSAWGVVATELCEATFVHKTQSDALFDTRTRCMEARLRDVNAVVELLASNSTVGVVNRSIQTVAGLQSPDECRELVPGPDVLDEGTVEQQALLSRAEATTDLGQYEDALAIVEGMLEQETNAVVRSRALIIAAANRTNLGKRDGVIEALREAGLLAAEAGADRMVAGVQIRLAQALYKSGQIREAEGTIESARIAVRRAGETPRLVSYFSRFLAGVYHDKQQYTEALAEIEKARGAATTLGDLLMLAKLDTDVGGMLAAVNRNDEAVAAVNRGLQSVAAMLGESHPSYATALRDAVETFINAGRYEEARIYGRQRLALVDKREPTDPENIARALTELAIADLELSDPEAVLEHSERALALYEGLPTPMPAGTAQAHKLLAHANSLLGNHDEAVRQIDAALKIQEAEYGPDAPLNAIAWHIYGEVLRKAGRCDEAIGRFERMAALVPNEKRFLAYANSGIGQCALELGRADARDVLELALELHSSHGSDTADIAEAQFDVARARDRDGETSGLELARTAEKALREPRSAKLHAKVEAWIREREAAG